jgi:hypothetical protein
MIFISFSTTCLTKSNFTFDDLLLFSHLDLSTQDTIVTSSEFSLSRCDYYYNKIIIYPTQILATTVLCLAIPASMWT